MPIKKHSKTPWPPSTSIRSPACSASYKNFFSRTASIPINTAPGCANFCANTLASSSRTLTTKASFPVCWSSFSGRPAKGHQCWLFETTCGRNHCRKRRNNSKLNLIIYKIRRPTRRSRTWAWASRRRTSRTCSMNLMNDAWIIMIFKGFWEGCSWMIAFD